MDCKHQVLRPNRRKRPAAWQSRADSGLPSWRCFHDAQGRQFTLPYLGSAAIRHRARRRLFFSAKLTRFTLLRRTWKSIEVLHQPYFLFDTREKGNDNQGHTYGTQLSNEDKEK